uniref:Uncharacterized protein n=1 Tax=Caldimicrobium thiodismutans TaxID=1653476 RepID=A0A832GLE7_9BACT
MGDEIKSTLEIALEKAARLGRASEEELKWEGYKEKALMLVGKFLKGEEENLPQKVTSFLKEIPPSFQKKILKVIVETLLKNLTLPREEYQLEEAKKILSNLQGILAKVPKIEQVFKETEKLLSEYFSQKEALYHELVKRFAAGLTALERAVSEQVGAKVKLSPEAHPQFQEEWNKLKEHLDREYGRQLDYIKSLILKILS